MQFRATPLRVSIRGDKLTVLARPQGFRGPVRIGVGNEVHELGAGDSWVFALPPEAEPADQSHLSHQEVIHHGDRL
jgi:hypothetical protein